MNPQCTAAIVSMKSGLSVHGNGHTVAINDSIHTLFHRIMLQIGQVTLL